MVNAAPPGTFAPLPPQHSFRPPVGAGQPTMIRETPSITVPANNQKQKSPTKRLKPVFIIGVVFVVLFAAGTAMALYLGSQRQDNRQQAYIAPTDPGFVTNNTFVSPSPATFDSPSPFPSSSTTDTTASSNPNAITTFVFDSPSPTTSSFALPSPSPILRQSVVATSSALMRTGNMTWTFVLLFGGMFSIIGGGVALAFNRRIA